MGAEDMKRQLAIMMVFLFVVSLIPFEYALGDNTGEYATISGIYLGLKDKVVLGSFSVELSDATSDWSRVSLEVNGPSGSKIFVGSSGDEFYYPSQSNPYLIISLVWIKKDTESVLITLKSPLKKLLSDQVLKKDQSIQLPEGFPKIKIYLSSFSVDTKKATFKIVYPYGSSDYVTVDEGSGDGANYRLPGDFVYINYLYLHVNKISTDGVNFDVYVPRVASVDFKVVKSGQSEESGETATQTEVFLVYNDLLYTGEKLPIILDNTTYYVKLISVVSTKASIEVYKGSKKLGTYFVNVGEIKQIPDTPLKVSVQEPEPQYSRATVLVYAPDGTQVTPILRPAEMVAEIDAMPKKIMLGDSLVVVISVENKGKGDAYDVTVAAPIPNGFELVSTTKSWTFKSLPAFTKMPALIYVLKPTKVGKFDIGKVVVTYYDDESLQTGEMKTVYSAPLTGIEVYDVPSIEVTAQAYNGTSWGKYVTAKENETVTLKFQVKASGENPDYEFIKNASLYVLLPEGQQAIKVGDLKAGDSKTVQASVKILNQTLYNVGARLVYYDPVGNKHELNLGNLVTINSIPPKVITKEVKVWPAPEELPAYVNKTLSELDDPTPLAEELANITAGYLPPKSNPWKPLAIAFILVAAVLGGVAYKYWDEAEKLKEKFERKKQRRPGGLPKKEEGEEKGTERL